MAGSARAGEHAGIPNTRVSTQAVSRVFQQLLIWNTLEHDVFQVCVADSGLPLLLLLLPTRESGNTISFA